MQINQNEIQRPTLITPFFGKELTPDNEYISYVDTSSDCISVTPTSNNSKTELSSHEKLIMQLKSSKTKSDIAYFLDCLIPNRHFVKLVDSYKKDELVQIKNEFLAAQNENKLAAQNENKLAAQNQLSIHELNHKVQYSPKFVIKSILEDIFDCEVSKSLNKKQLFSKYLVQTCRYFELNSDDLDACENLKRDIYKNLL